ncbi:unnamed protein product [Lymnaea stagnalis]|uniref:Uncharacterized protein n=1 Tax=Lymnaea stagnalis TaxID=6523 RepID=A0AAV2I811_LYMST
MPDLFYSMMFTILPVVMTSIECMTLINTSSFNNDIECMTLINFVYFIRSVLKMACSADATLTFLFLLAAFRLSKGCFPAACQFDQYQKTDVVCFGPNLISFPSLSGCPVNVSALSLVATNVSTLSDNIVPPGLTSLKFLDNRITSFSDGALDRVASSLRVLRFESSLTTIIPSAFMHLTGLEEFDIVYAEITDWNIPVLQQIGATVKKMYLSDANIFSWPTWISDFTSLETLEIFNSAIVTLPDDALAHVNNKLYLLTLSVGKLASIPHAISALSNITDLNLQNNQITNLRNLPRSAVNLDFTFNLITEITDETFVSMRNLKSVYLDSNPLQTISRHAFDGCPSLQSLSLGQTRVSRLPLGLSALTAPSYIQFGENPDLVCTCQESGLTPWFLSHKQMDFSGNCNSMINIVDFYTKLAKDCPQEMAIGPNNTTITN